MTHYLGNKKFYVYNADEKLVYKVNEFEVYYNSEAIHIYLELVAGWDYINQDENDVQGWCPADRFVEEIQSEIVAQYFLKEGMEEALEENGYTILKEEDISNSLKEVIDKHEELV